MTIHCIKKIEPVKPRKFRVITINVTVSQKMRKMYNFMSDFVTKNTIG